MLQPCKSRLRRVFIPGGLAGSKVTVRHMSLLANAAKILSQSTITSSLASKMLKFALPRQSPSALPSSKQSPPVLSSDMTSKLWARAVSTAEAVALPPHAPKLANSMDTLAAEMGSLTSSIKKLLAADHTLLRRMAQYYFDQNGKKVRPLIVLLVSQAALATNTPGSTSTPVTTEYTYIDVPMAPKSNFNDVDLVHAMGGPDTYLPDQKLGGVLPTQRRLAEITEMIHTASLLHDDVTDQADTRRGVATVNADYGNKLAILAGDFLLARASVALARLRHCEVVELMATTVANLVEGEVLQLRNTADPANANKQKLSLSPIANLNPGFEHYMEKSYMKTASLIANSCRAAVALGGYPENLKDAAYDYGKHFGLAFQLIDDLLDFTACATTFGKPAGGVDLELGLATAPVLYAAEEYPELRPLIARRFTEKGDVALAFELVHASNGLQLTRELAEKHVHVAIDALSDWPPSPARDALVQLSQKILTRTK